MPSQPGSKTIAINTLPNTARSKGNQTMKLDELIEYNKTNTFFKNYPENEAGRLVPELFLFFEKA